MIRDAKLTASPQGPAVLVRPAVVTASAVAPPARGRLASPGRWAITIVATALSTWALEVIATSAGVLLAASHVLHETPRGLLLGILAGTYVLWVAGLRKNLVANARLLEQTGTSTNAPSKAMFELARRRSSSQRAVRAASMAGYVVTEVAKEVPYYASAFGAALLSDSVDSTDALVFLSGTNIGAAVYECCVARLTSSFLEGRSRRLARRRPPPVPDADESAVPRLRHPVGGRAGDV